MSKNIPDANIDDMLELREGTECCVCTTEPTTYTEATVTNMLAIETISGANYTLANGDSSGRKNTCAPPAGTSITNTGLAQHVAVCSNGNTLELVTTCPDTNLTSGGTVDIGPFDHEIGDVT